MAPDSNKDPVRHTAGHAQRAWAARRNPHRHGSSVWQAGRAGGVDLDFLTRQQTAGEDRRLFQLGHFGRAVAHESHCGIADPIRLQGATRGAGCDRGNR